MLVRALLVAFNGCGTLDKIAYNHWGYLTLPNYQNIWY